MRNAGAGGNRCWIAPRDIRPGAEWSESIIGIRRARMFVLVFSGRANASGHVRREVERAVSHGLIVIPFRVEDVLPEGALEYHLGAVHWLDAMTPPLDTHIKRLAETARSIIAADATVDLACPLESISRPVFRRNHRGASTTGRTSLGTNAGPAAANRGCNASSSRNLVR